MSVKYYNSNVFNFDRNSPVLSTASLTHWGLDEVANISNRSLSIAFYEKKKSYN